MAEVKKDSEIRPIKEFEFNLFAHWIALPQKLRNPQTQGEFSQQNGVSQDMLSIWKRYDNFWDKVDKYRMEWIRDEISDVVKAMAEQARRGNVGAARVFLEIAEKLAASAPASGSDSDTPMSKEQAQKFLETWRRMLLNPDDTSRPTT